MATNISEWEPVESESDWEPVAEPQGIFAAPSGLDVGVLSGQLSSAITGVPTISLPENRPVQDWFAPSIPEVPAGVTPEIEPELPQAPLSPEQQEERFVQQFAPMEISGQKPLPTFAAVGAPNIPLAAPKPDFAETAAQLTTPVVPIEKLEIYRDDPKWVAVGKSVANFLAGILEFAESPAGVITGGAAAAVPKTVAGLFSADMVKNLGQQVYRAHKDWDKMSEGQRAAAITDMVQTGALGAALGAKATEGLRLKKPSATGETYASEIAKAEGVPQLEVRPRVGEEAPLRQPGEVAERVVRGSEGEVLPPFEPPAEVGIKPTEQTAESLLSKPLGSHSAEDVASFPEPEWTKAMQMPKGGGWSLTADATAWAMNQKSSSELIARLEQLAKQDRDAAMARGEFPMKMQWYQDAAHVLKGDEVGVNNVKTVGDMAAAGKIKLATAPTEPAKPTTAGAAGRPDFETIEIGKFKDEMEASKSVDENVNQRFYRKVGENYVVFEDRPTAGAAEAAPAGAPKPGIISGTALEKWASDRLAESQKRLTVGIDPELMAAYAIKGAAILERGVRDFAKWSGEMVKEYGENIKPHLRRIYQQANNVFTTPGRYAIEEGKLKIVSEQEARRMERAVKLSKNVAGIKDQLDLFDKEIGEALTEGGRFLPKDLRPEVAKGAPAEKRTVTNKEINQYFVNKLVTVRKAMQKLKTEMDTTADPASQQYFDVLQKRFELAFRQVQELRRASHESLYFWNEIKAEYQDIARMAGEMPEIKRRLPIIDQIFKDLKNKEFARAGKDFVDYLRVNLFTPFSFTLDFTSNVLAVAGHTPAWLAMDMAHLITGKPMTRTASALRALKLSGKNMIPTAERFRLPEEIEVGLGTTAGGEFQGLPKEVMVDFSEILKSKPKLAEKLKNLDYILGGPVRMKRAVDNFFGRFGATAELYNAAYQAGRSKGLKGDGLKQFVDQFVLNPPEQAVADAIRVGGEFKFNRNLPAWAERFASNIITKLAVESYPRWTLQFTKWAGEMLGVDPGFIRKAAKGEVTPEHVASYLAKAATGWGALYAFNQLFYNQVDPNTMEYVNEKGERVRLSGRQPFPELYMLTALFRGDIDNAKAAFPYTSIPFAGMTGGQGGLLSPIMQTMIESWKGNYTAEQTARELTKIVNNAIPGKSMLGLIRAIYDPTIREGIGAPIPGVAQALPTRVNVTTGEPMAPKQRIPGTPIKLPTVGGTPFPGAVRMLNPIEKTLLNHGISNVRPKRTSLIELPAEEIPKELRREYEQHVGRNVNAIIGEAIQSKDWLDLAGKENFDTRRELLMAWMTLARTMAKAELAEKYNKGMGAEKTAPLTVRRLPEFVKELPAPR